MQGEIKVIDFGIAQLLTDKLDEKSPNRQRLIGTPVYMSPEQRENPSLVSYPSDIYSLGIIAYELITGKLNHGQIHLSLIPKGLQKIISKTLQPKPEDRYQDIVDFISDVSIYLNSSDFQRDRKGADYLIEIFEHLQNAEMSLLPSQPPHWNGIEIGVAYHKGMHLSGIYFDFFETSNQSFAVIATEPKAKGVEGTIYTAVLRGLIRSSACEIKHPKEWLESLNRLVFQDPIKQAFNLCLLILEPKLHCFHFISCGYGSLWHANSHENSIQSFSPQPYSIGESENISINCHTKVWNEGDILLIQGFSPKLMETSHRETENLLKKIFLEHLEKHPQQQTEAIMRKIKTSPIKDLQEHSFTLINLQRAKGS